MTISEREKELDLLYKSGTISYSDWALLWLQAQHDEETYPNE